jgi:hypothetical protein
MSDEPDEIESQMRAVRARLDAARCQVRTAGRRWRDWRVHVRAHPALVGLTVGALGYFLVPRRGGAKVLASAALPIAAPGSLIGKLLVVGLRQGLPLLVGLAAERIQRSQRQTLQSAEPQETAESFARRRPR